MAQIILDQVDKVYPDGVRALDDLSLAVGEGEFMVLVGPPRCGMSTTLRSIAGLEEITGGTISIGARVVNNLPPKDRDIAMMLKNYALYPHMSVAENLSFGLKLRMIPRAEIRQRVNKAAKMLGLEPYHYRAAPGQIMSESPDFTHLDDPAFLDARARLRDRLEHVPENASGRAGLERLYEAMTGEFLRRARIAWTSAPAPAPGCATR